MGQPVMFLHADLRRFVKAVEKCENPLCLVSGVATLPRDRAETGAEGRQVIGRDGAVSNVSNGDSDLPDSNVVGCVVKACYGLSFPKPEGGIVTVSYPIMLQPG